MPVAADEGAQPTSGRVGSVRNVHDAVTSAIAELGDIATRDVALAPLTTYRVGGSAAVFVRARHEQDLQRVAAAWSASGLPVLVVGRGSNLLVADGGFHGIALSMAAGAMPTGTDADTAVDTDGAVDADSATDIAVDTDSGIVTVGSAVLLPVLARRLAIAGLSGFEWAVGVPGSIGGAVRMNAGGHGSDMTASLVDVTVFDLTTGRSDVIGADRLGLRFRGSALTPTSVVVRARLQLSPGDPQTARRELAEIVAWRRANQPGGQNAGSVFVNPVPGELSAGRLIDESGLRGFRQRSAAVSQKHANFIQSDPGGSADDVVAVMDIVRERVAETSGHVLRSEIRLIGFDGDDG